MNPDLVRVLNLIIAAVDLSLLVWLAVVRWHEITPPRRVLWLGCAVLLLSIAYGSIEAVYFDGQARVGLLAMGLVMLGMGFAAELREAYQARTRR